jgi:RHS repeat-associated protein
VSRNAYAPYGTTRGAGTSAGNDGLAISRGWLNQVSDEASTGLVYLNARYYDPLVARFVSPDPLMNPTDPKTLDPYRYADNNPISYTDATGLFSCPTWMPKGVCDEYNDAAAKVNAAKVKAKSTMGPGGGKCTNYDPCVIDNLKAQGAYNPGTFNNIQAVTNDGNLDWVDVSNSPPVTPAERARAQIVTVVAVTAFLCARFRALCFTDEGVGPFGPRGAAIDGAMIDGVAAGTFDGAPARVGGFNIANGRFSQKTYGEAFSKDPESPFVNLTISDVTANLRSGAMTAQDVPINVINRGGTTLILNTRSSQALIRAGIPRSEWYVVDRTGSQQWEGWLDDQLTGNQLGSDGLYGEPRSTG